MTLQFSVGLSQGWGTGPVEIEDAVEAYETLTRVVQTAEELGFDGVWLPDYFQTPQATRSAFFECWTTTAALARDTMRIRIGQLITNNELRNPALLAKMASTVDVLSRGRLNFGIGSGGWSENTARAYGYAYSDSAERLRHLREAVQVILAMWTQEEATFEGEYYQIRGAINQPKGVQKPHIPLLIAGGGEQVTLKLVAQYADACNIPGHAATLRQKFATLKQHCEAIGRDYESIHRTVGSFCFIGETEEQARAKVPPGLLERRGPAIRVLVGTPDTIRKELDELEAAGVQEVVLIFPDTLQLDSLRLFAKEFI